MHESAQGSRRPASVGKTFLRTFLLSLVLSLIAFPAASHAGVTTAIVPDGTLSTTVTKTGNVFDITDGTRPGNGPNLFHSFGQFSVGAGDIANFSNNTGLPTSNILGRVTWGNPSNIFGTIQTTGFGSANLFLLNPAGVLFGSTASLNVGGSFHVSTADYLRLTDGARFKVIPGLQDALLSIAPVAAFGFLNSSPASITVDGAFLSVPAGQAISLLGGNRTFMREDTGNMVPPGVTMTGGALLAPGGQINLASVASAGEILFPSLQFGPNVNGDSFGALGTISLSQGASLDVSSNVDPITGDVTSGSGVVVIRGGRLMIDQSSIAANNLAGSNGANPAIDIQVAQDVTLTNGAVIASSTSGAGRGGDVRITAGSLSLDGGGTAITTQTDGDGNAGDIVANVGTLSLTGRALIQSNNNLNFTFGAGQGGNVTIQGLLGAGSAADSVTLTSDAFIITQTFGPGRGGDVSITTGALHLDNVPTFGISSFTQIGDGVGGNILLRVGTLNLTGGSKIHSFSFSPGAGQGGNVTIQGLQGAGSSADSVALSAGSQVLSETLASGNGGRITIFAKSLAMNTGATINTYTADVGRGGNIELDVQSLGLSGGANIASHSSSSDIAAGAGGTVTVQGLDGPGSKADSVTFSGTDSGIISDSTGTAPLSDIAVHTRSLSLTSGAVISAGSPASTVTTAGNVTVEADSAMISGGSRISSQAFAADAGQMTISANALTLDNGTITTSTVGSGNAGAITITPTGNSISLSNGSSITSSTTNSGNAGQVVLTTAMLSLDNASITTTTNSSGNAGTITANVGALTLTNASAVSSSSTGTATGAAGSVTIQGLASPADSVTLTNSTVATSAESTGRGGRISVDAINLTMNNGTISASVKDFGSAPDGATVGLGNIALTASTLNMSGGTITAATTGTRNAGSVSLNVTDLAQTGGARIDSSTIGGGQGGALTLTAVNSVTLTDPGTGLFSTASGTGAGGDISVQASSVQMFSGSVISANSTGTATASAGTVKIVAGELLRMKDSSITTESVVADGGDISIKTTGSLVHLTNSQIATSVQADLGAGGNITIGSAPHPVDFLILNDGGIHANAFGGPGGNINIFANSFLSSTPISSAVTASSALSSPGTIDIQASTTDVNDRVVRLPDAILQAATLLRASCAARVAEGKSSSLVLAARDGLPLEPGSLLPSPLYVAADSVIGLGGRRPSGRKLVASHSQSALFGSSGERVQLSREWDQFRAARTALGFACSQ